MARRSIVTVDLENLAPIARGLRESPEKTREGLRRAVNFAADRARTLGKRKILADARLDSTYVDRRLKVSKTATLSDLTANVTGTDRGISLARYATNRSAAGKRGVKPVLQVKPNGAKREVKRGFLVNLKRGRADTGNVGLAIRVPNGALSGRRRGTAGLVQFGKKGKTSTAYLFYGPSVDQLFDRTRDDIAPEVSRRLESEALRQLRLLGVTRG
jgi:hypothetical protein